MKMQIFAKEFALAIFVNILQKGWMKVASFWQSCLPCCILALILLLGVVVPSASAQVVYSEDFTSPQTKVSFTGEARYGNGGMYQFNTWVGFHNGAAGAAFDSGDFIGRATPQTTASSFPSAIAILLDPELFGSAGDQYIVSFDVYGDLAGETYGPRYFLDLISGYGNRAGVVIDTIISNNRAEVSNFTNWGGAPGYSLEFVFRSGGMESQNVVIDRRLESALAGATSSGPTKVEFTFTYDGKSAVGFAVGTYNNAFSIDNFEVRKR